MLFSTISVLMVRTTIVFFCGNKGKQIYKNLKSEFVEKLQFGSASDAETYLLHEECTIICIIMVPVTSG